MSARIIEAKAVISAEDRSAATFAAMAKRMAEMSKTQTAFNKAGSAQATKMAGDMAKLDKKLAQMEGFRKLSANIDTVGTYFRRTQAEAARLKVAMQAAGAAGGALSKDYDRAVRAMDAAKKAYLDQITATKNARQAIESTGLSVSQLSSKQGYLRSQIDATSAAMRRQTQVAKAANVNPWGAVPRSGSGVPLIPQRPIAQQKPAPQHRNRPSGESQPEALAEAGGATIVPFGGLKAAGVLGAVYAGKKVHDFVVENHHDFQRAKLYQQAVLGVNAESQASMVAQAEQIGKDTRFTNADVVKAQTDIGGKLPKEMQKSAIIEAITENTKNYALAMQVSMEEAAQAVVGYMKSWGYDLSTAEAAASSSKRAANMLVQQAKTTGAKHHDLIGSTKFGAAPARAGGFSEEMINAIQAQLIRVGYEGAMAGTFSRAVATKLAVPSRQGMAAIAGTGVDFNQFRKPGSVPATADSLSKMLQLQFGRSLGKAEQEKVQALLDDTEVMGDKGAYTEKLSEILNEGYARRTKSGKVDARQAQALTRVSDQFYNVISGGVDTQGLFIAIVEKGMNAAIARYLFGQEHGGRAIGLDPKAIKRDYEDNKHVPGDRAEVVAKKLQEGAQGEYNQMVGSVQTFGVALGESTDALRQFTYKGIGSVFDYMTDMLKGKDIKPGVGANTVVSKEGAPYRLDTWSADAIGIYERSRRVDAEFRRDPEAARGRAMQSLSRNAGQQDLSLLRNIEAVVKDPVPVKVDPVELKGKAIVDITVKAADGAQVTGMRVQSSGAVQAEGTALIGRFGRN